MSASALDCLSASKWGGGKEKVILKKQLSVPPKISGFIYIESLDNRRFV